MGKVCENEKRDGEMRIIEKREHDATTYDAAKTSAYVGGARCNAGVS